MIISEHAFFHQATVLICRHLDIETSLAELFKFLQKYIPTKALFLNLFEEDFGAIRTIATADATGGARVDRLTYLDQAAREYMRLGEKYLKQYGRLKAQIINEPQDHTVSKLMVADFDSPDTSHLALSLSIDDKLIGNLIIEGAGNHCFSKEHAEIFSLLNEPMAIAMANALKHDEIVRLNDNLLEDNRYLRKETSQVAGDDLIGRDFGLKTVVRKVEQVAPLDSPVLLLGETGTGKELLAAQIHHQSARRNHSLITINCGAIPDTLLDSELFGHEKGAFTGALTQKKGHFERAGGGTIFLDEVGELPPQAQVRLLRVLQNREIQRVGGTESISVDIRIVAATHRDLALMVKEGTFRDDLYFRLNVFPIEVTALRQRTNDIPALVQHLIEKKSKSLNIRPFPRLREGAIDALVAYDWPGNVRELENIIERALILYEDGPLAFDHLLPGMNAEKTFDQNAIGGPLPSLDRMIKNHLAAAIQAAGGRIHGPGGAAELIGLNPNTFRSKMRKLGMMK